jgi:hypothetical protein
MSYDTLAILKEQAERLLMVLPGHLQHTPIDTVREQLVQMYDFDVRNPDTSSRAKAIATRMLNWFATCEWARASMIAKNEIDPSEIGIFRWHTWGGGKSFSVYCHDRVHYEQLNQTVEFRDQTFSKNSWNRHARRCFYTLVLTDGESHEVNNVG